MIVGGFQLDAENGAWFEAAIEHFAQRPEPRPETTADGTGDTIGTDGEDTITAPERTPGQVAADALGEIFRTAMGSEHAGAATGAERPRILVTTGLDTLRDARADDEPAAPDTEPGPGPPCSVPPARYSASAGRSARSPRAQRRALHARDRGCVMPNCTAPARRCEDHHVRWWRHGGTTDIQNLCLLCASCHTLVHLAGWELVVIDGIPLDPTTRIR